MVITGSGIRQWPPGQGDISSARIALMRCIWCHACASKGCETLEVLRIVFFFFPFRPENIQTVLCVVMFVEKGKRLHSSQLLCRRSSIAAKQALLDWSCWQSHTCATSPKQRIMVHLLLPLSDYLHLLLQKWFTRLYYPTSSTQFNSFRKAAGCQAWLRRRDVGS